MIEVQDMNRSQLDTRLRAGQFAHDPADYAAMRHHQRVASLATLVRRPEGEHPLNATLDPLGKSSAALALGIRVAGREAIDIPAGKLLGKALADFVRS